MAGRDRSVITTPVIMERLLERAEETVGVWHWGIVIPNAFVTRGIRGVIAKSTVQVIVRGIIRLGVPAISKGFWHTDAIREEDVRIKPTRINPCPGFVFTRATQMYRTPFVNARAPTIVKSLVHAITTVQIPAQTRNQSRITRPVIRSPGGFVGTARAYRMMDPHLLPRCPNPPWLPRLRHRVRHPLRYRHLPPRHRRQTKNCRAVVFVPGRFPISVPKTYLTW
mmetsp:Transcript_17138/g.20987  ORF Transcript_17138/g.20987 Transcript_17138/m.20987 type:complete len:224 (-) Transcript_17138:1372-2043(-)